MINKTKKIRIGYGDVSPVYIGGDAPLAYMLGPCAIESLDHSLFMADKISDICRRIGVKWIYKSCYNKDCRSSIESFHGVGLEKGLKILERIRTEFDVPVLSDFSIPEWAAPTAEVCDLIQLPAYLCRQTSMLEAAGTTGRPVHVKKGQFMSPHNMKNLVTKLNYFGCDDILLTDRGTFFGYGGLVSDFTCLPIMQETGYPVCFDGTHSVQQPTTSGIKSTGLVEYIPHLVRASVGVGVNAIFMEVHDKPEEALSDGGTVLRLDRLEEILRQTSEIYNLTKDWENV